MSNVIPIRRPKRPFESSRWRVAWVVRDGQCYVERRDEAYGVATFGAHQQYYKSGAKTGVDGYE